MPKNTTRNICGHAANWMRSYKTAALTIALAALTLASQPAHAAGSIAVSYAASQSPLVVGQAGQHYKLNITVTGGPIAGGMGLLGALPAGILTNGAISTSGGNLAGCPAAGAGSLVGCVLTNAPNGLVSITIPIAVGAAATTGSAQFQVNPGAGVGCAGGGNLCRADSQSIGILDAVNDAAMSAAGAAGSFALNANDKAPVGAIFSLASGSTCAASAVSAAGLASYTAPAAGQSCTVNYKLCLAAVCDTAALSVTAQGAANPTGSTGGLSSLTVASPVLTQGPKATTLPPGPRTVLPGGVVIPHVLTANQPPPPSRFAKMPKSDGFYDVTECVKDTVTGLIWEGKTASGARASGNQYTNYDNVNHAQLWGGGNPTTTHINASSNSIGYKNYVNSLSLCGSGTWRLPTSSELVGWRSAWRAMDIGTRALLIPNVGLFTTWTSSPDVGSTLSAWASSFSPDSDFTDVRWGSRFVRLVR